MSADQNKPAVASARRLPPGVSAATFGASFLFVYWLFGVLDAKLDDAFSARGVAFVMAVVAVSETLKAICRMALKSRSKAS
jgi:hypothetical protein